MINFDKKYFDDIWGTVHRHDYCNNLAEQLINKYGKVRILDIGTGCGYLVKVLREKGCDAWGIDVSEYAVKNRCSDHVLLGDICDIPFKDNYFDLAFSQGLWEYIPEDEVNKAVKEVKRVARMQEHNIDTSETKTFPEYKLVTEKSQAWWDEQFNKEYSKILVACPAYDGKSYSFGEWLRNVENLTYPNYEVFVVDNSESLEFFNKWKQFVPMKHIDTNPKLQMLAITKSMEVIRNKFLEGNYTWWFNLECDVIPPKDIIEQLIKLGGDSDWISHAYPTRGNQSDDQQGIGCSLLSRRIAEDFNWNEAGDNSPDGWLWQKVKPVRKYKTMELWGYLKIDHLKE